MHEERCVELVENKILNFLTINQIHFKCNMTKTYVHSMRVYVNTPQYRRETATRQYLCLLAQLRPLGRSTNVAVSGVHSASASTFDFYTAAITVAGIWRLVAC